MAKDYRLLDEALTVLQDIKPWINADYYRNHISPLVLKIRERLAAIDSEQFKNPIILSNKKFSDTVPDPYYQVAKNTGYLSELDEPLTTITTNFGIFKDLKGERCNPHPKAPHQYLQELSKSMGRYVCQCEFWSPDS